MEGTDSAYLFGLAFEALLGLVGPPACKGGFPRIDHARIKGMDLSIVAKVCLDGRHDCPAAVGSVLKMLHDRIVILFPPSERLAAEKAFDAIGTPIERVEEEAGFRKLDGACRVSAGQSITTVGIEAHIDWREPFVRPMLRLGRARARVGRSTFPSGRLRALKGRQAVLVGKVSVAASGHGHSRRHCRGATPAGRGSGKMFAREVGEDGDTLLRGRGRAVEDWKCR